MRISEAELSACTTLWQQAETTLADTPFRHQDDIYHTHTNAPHTPTPLHTSTHTIMTDILYNDKQNEKTIFKNKMRTFVCSYMNWSGGEKTTTTKGGGGGVKKKKKVVNSTRCSQAVTHPSTNWARRCLTSVIGREPVLSTWYGRWRQTVQM